MFIEATRNDMRSRHALSQIRAKREASGQPFAYEPMRDADTFAGSPMDLLVN
ncbi:MULTISPECIES: hypothetical protein [Paraburkholderia]|uniref:hypothetical protein n=1 Tax=Paraburkholderia TaxID=1822464 RepID=UPI001655E349|nr:hypothetical protein [Paraburkholderia podalyriae]